jgi:hypothetical protein
MEEGGRVSLISIRNYCNGAELLITDTKGNFLFYGRYDISLGIDFIADQYWAIFNQVKPWIESVLENISEFKNIHLSDEVTPTEGFKILKAYQKSHLMDLKIK